MRNLWFASAVVVLALCASSAHAQLLGPSPYLSAADSPLSSVVFADYFHLEDFEDGALNTPGLSANAGFATTPGPQIDSVDADDGVIDGSGNNGRPWYSGGGSTVLRFTFDGITLGDFPTHAGLVWTDVGIVSGGPLGFAEFVFEAFDPVGASLGVYGPFVLGDGSINGGTAEDRFFGFASAGGISAIEARMPTSGDWEVDHVQYGRVPEPAGVVSFGALLLIAGSRFRRR